MTTTSQQGIETALAEIPDDEDVVIVKNEVGAVAAINRSELESQLDAAHKYPRSIKGFMRDAMGRATLTKSVAMSCIYSVPRAGKKITGPSVRLAEIAASAYGNLHVGARPMEVGRDTVVSQGVAWDLEKNLRITIEATRRITDRNGNRFNDDMIVMTQGAATSIALRNAIFRVIPRAYIDMLYEHVVKVVAGDAKTLVERRDEIVNFLQEKGVTVERILNVAGKTDIGDLDLGDISHMVGLNTAVANGDATYEEAFPLPAAPMPGGEDGQPVEEGRRVRLGRGGRKME